MTAYPYRPDEYDPGADHAYTADAYFDLGGGVGPDAANDRADVARIQTLLGRTGHVDLGATDGPTGWYGKPLELAIRRYQRDRGLAVDGIVLPAAADPDLAASGVGETIAALQADVGNDFAGLVPPGPRDLDAHHEARARGEDGWLVTDPAGPRPLGTRRPVPGSLLDPAAFGADNGGGGSTRRETGRDIASMAKEMRGRDPLGPMWPDGGRIFLGGGSRGARSGVGNPIDRAVGNAGQAPGQETAVDAIEAQSVRAALHDGIAAGFGDPVEARHETANTKKSANIMIKECEDVLRTKINPRGFSFEHIAGGSEKGEGQTEISERAFKGGKFRKGGGGHSFPDLLFLDKERVLYVGVNIATESRPDEYVAREVGSFDALVRNMGEWVAAITGKKRDSESDDDYASRVRRTCEETFAKAIESALDKKDRNGPAPRHSPGDQPKTP